MFDRGLVSRICKELLQSNNKKENYSIKNGQTMWINIPSKNRYKWPGNT